MMAQGMIALGAYTAVARITAIGAAAGIAASCLLIGPLGLYAILVGELVSHILGFVLMHIDISRFSRLTGSRFERAAM
jgi:hypothetical protein